MRRSFLARVAGAGALIGMAGRGHAHPVSDSDPKDPTGQGVNGGRWPASDTDQGPRADPVGRAGRLGHFTDRDRGAAADPPGHGRRLVDADTGPINDAPGTRLAISDGDAAPHADPPGRGRRPPRR